MTVSQQLLLELHSVHTQLAELRGRRERGPRQVAAHATNVKRHEDAVEAAHQAVLDAKKLVDQKQLDLKSGEGRIADWKVKLNQCSSNKEYQALSEQIAAAEMANSVLEDEILEGLDRIETLEANVAAAHEQLARAKSESQKVAQRVADEKNVIEQDIARLQERLSEEEKKIPTDIRSNYQRVVRAKGADALAPVEDGVCTGCGQQLTLESQNDMSMGRMAFCKVCGRLLYLQQ